VGRIGAHQCDHDGKSIPELKLWMAQGDRLMKQVEADRKVWIVARDRRYHGIEGRRRY
jgi:hypothetical protein